MKSILAVIPKIVVQKTSNFYNIILYKKYFILSKSKLKFLIKTFISYFSTVQVSSNSLNYFMVLKLKFWRMSNFTLNNDYFPCNPYWILKTVKTFLLKDL